MPKFLIICFIIMMMNCKNNSNHYMINSCEDSKYSVDHNGILYLTESANYHSLQTLKDTIGLKQYLNEDEMKHAFDTSVEISEFDTINYYNTELIPWDTLLVKHNFMAEIVLLKDNTKSRAYYFQIRTFDKRRTLISIQDFAIWDESEKKFCSGDYAKEEQTFTVICEEQSFKYNFDENGKILPSK